MKKIVLFLSFALLLFGQNFLSNEEKISDEELKEMIGQMIIVGLPNKNANSKFTKQIIKDAQDGKIGGIVLSAKNIGSKSELKSLTQAFNSENLPYKLLIAIDEEGGNVSRFSKKNGYKTFPSAYFVGSTKNLNEAREIYKDMATQLKNFGINLNFAPVVDIYNISSTISTDNRRAFSDDIDEIIAYAGEFIEIFSQVGVKTTLKHFPGLGNSNTDTHKQKSVIVNYEIDELKPYYELLKRNQVNFVMITHAVVATLDSDNPAVFSQKIVTNILKKRLNFGGVVVSDELLMKGLGSEKIGEKIIKAVNAGIDIVLIGDYFLEKSNATKIANDAIFNAVKSGKISPERIIDAYTRITKIKATL